MNNVEPDGMVFICLFRLLLLLVCFFWSFCRFSVLKTGKRWAQTNVVEVKVHTNHAWHCIRRLCSATIASA